MTKAFDNHEHNFEAEITIYPLGPQTRLSHPHNGIRWAFAYLDEFELNGSPLQISDIWPEFVDQSGNTIAGDTPLMGKLNARMHIVSEEMVDWHMQRIKVGTKFYCMEGNRKCAGGIVTAI